MCVSMCVHVCVHVCVCACMRARVYACMHVCVFFLFCFCKTVSYCIAKAERRSLQHWPHCWCLPGWWSFPERRRGCSLSRCPGCRSQPLCHGTLPGSSRSARSPRKECTLPRWNSYSFTCAHSSSSSPWYNWDNVNWLTGCKTPSHLLTNSSTSCSKGVLGAHF